MEGNKIILDDKTKIIVVVIAVLIILFPVGYSVVAFAIAPSAQPFLEEADGEPCVRDLKYMRHNHWVLLKKVRDEVIHEAKQAEVKLKDCRKCHKSRERFCDKCHNAVNINFNCFDCHYYP
ncbi:MAG: hypothetical protein E3J72_17745 [Planctomycetota bacterium]|nr:MAG: hypothetical protein E3J72_17745 [Planctomycetota bacterium]